jgi:hypothetical protein
MLASERDLPVSLGVLPARAGIEGRCPVIAVAAPNAEEVHDYIDELLEADGAFDVLTTFDSGPEAVEDAAAILGTGLAGEGTVFAFCVDPVVVENALRSIGLLG